MQGKVGRSICTASRPPLALVFANWLVIEILFAALFLTHVHDAIEVDITTHDGRLYQSLHDTFCDRSLIEIAARAEHVGGGGTEM